MSESVNSNTNNTSLASDLKSTLLFTGALQAPGAISSAVRNGGVKKAIDSVELKKFKELNLKLKEAKVDNFTKGINLSESYETYKGIAKKAQKLEKIGKTVEKTGDIPLSRKFLNLFSKKRNKITAENFQDTLELATKNRKIAQEAIEQGSVISKTATGEIATKAASEVAKASGKQTIGKLFKSEIKNPIVLLMTAMSAIPRITEEVIPTFKEEGFVAGMKATGKVAARTAFDFLSNAGFSAVGRAVGTAIGSIFPGVGNFIGGMVGDAIGTTISMKITSKVFDDKESSTEQSIQTESTEQQEDESEEDKIYSNAETTSTDEESLTGNPSLDRRINRALTI